MCVYVCVYASCNISYINTYFLFTSLEYWIMFVLYYLFF